MGSNGDKREFKVIYIFEWSFERTKRVLSSIRI